MCGPQLKNSTVGIVGLGRIGIRIAQCLKPFNVGRIIFTSRTEKPAASEFGGQRVDFETLLKESDFVIVIISLTPETREMFDKKAFEMMKKTAILINVSRGDIIHQPSLIEALKNGTIRAAGLDVMTPEPIPLDSELLKLDNCGKRIYKLKIYSEISIIIFAMSNQPAFIFFIRSISVNLLLF